MQGIPRVVKVLMAFLALFYIVAFTLVVLVDFLDAFGLQGWLLERAGDESLVWFLLFKEEGPAEIMQYAANLGSAVFIALIGGGLLAKGSPDAKRFLIFAGALAYMVLEDTGNVRHMIRETSTAVLGIAEGPTSLVGIGIELGIYAVLGAVMVFAFYSLRHVLKRYRPAFALMLVGYVFYFFGALFSASRHFNSWYIQVGGRIVDGLDLMRFEAWRRVDSFVMERFAQPIEFFLVDYLLEESLELAGAAFILFATLTLFIGMRRTGVLSLEEGK